MNPGDDGGWLPSRCLLLLRRKKKQHPNRIAAIPSRAKGTPTPIPIFWRLVSPVVLKAGAAVPGVLLEVGAELAVEDLDSIGVRDLLEDLVAETPFDDDTELKVVVIESVTDPDSDDEYAALLDIEPEADSSVCDGCHQSVSVGCSVAVTDTSLFQSLVEGVAVGHAVSGPNSLMR